jgi:hypothetical protein
MRTGEALCGIEVGRGIPEAFRTVWIAEAIAKRKFFKKLWIRHFRDYYQDSAKRLLRCNHQIWVGFVIFNCFLA